MSKFLYAGVLVVALFFSAFPVSAQTMQGGLYKIQGDSVNVGGTEVSSSVLYQVSDTVGEVATGESETLLSRIKAGYRQLVDTVSGAGGGAGGGSGGGSSSGGGAVVVSSGVPLSMSELRVRPATDRVEISFLTNEPAYADMSWGLDGSFDRGTGGHADLTYAHSFQINNLSPNTRHYVEILLRSGTGELLRHALAFTTLSADAAISEEEVANPIPVSAQSTQEKIVVSWTLPSDAQSVLVTRSIGSPLEDAKVVFSGAGTFYEDTDVTSGENYFYIVYAVGAHNTLSSGVAVQAVLEGTNIIDPYSTYQGTVDSKLTRLTFSDIDIIQNGQKINSEGEKVVLLDNQPFVIWIDYEKLPEVLKTIAVTLSDRGSDESFTFVLRVNEAKTGYQAVVGALGRTGEFDMGISIVDHENRGVRTIQETMSVASAFSQKIDENLTKAKTVVENLFVQYSQFVFLALLLGILTALKIISRRISIRS